MDWEKLARACRRYLDAYNDEIADDITIGSVGNDLRIIAIREVHASDDLIRSALERRMACYLESELSPNATFEAKVDELLNSYGALLRKFDHQLVEERDDASEEQHGCCGACRGQGHVQGDPCSDCLTSGHAHDPADPCPAPQEQP